ncbi:MAG: metallophosphoesterase family protein [Candidatus Hydrogenedentes bacterium]|nr:metallophosphoesterase family protein [Candidatus Hydrogenedentota bacterium]
MTACRRWGAVVSVLVWAALASQAEPLHVYLTYSGAPETSIDINVLEREKVAAPVDVYYDTEPRGGDAKAYTNKITAGYVQSTMELSDRRALYVAPLKDLKPGTTYYFVGGEAKYGMSTERKFRTLPGGDAPFRFVNGGDMGADGLVIPLLTLAGKENPDFGIVGGDIAYVNGLLGGFATWDKWLDNWDQLMVTTDGRMIPIVTAIGNHEVNRYESTEFSMTSPWYMGLFGRQGRNVFHTKKVGDNAVFFLLDSGHLEPHDGKQTAWLKQELEQHKDVKYKFAAYHVPLYPAHRPYDGGGSKLGREHWGPLFDEYNLTLGMEHHDHVFKRSKPLKDGKVVKKGTVYIGDGCFGREARVIDPQVRWYNRVEKSAAHFWVVDVSKRGLKLRAIDDKGAEIDRFSLP